MITVEELGQLLLLVSRQQADPEQRFDLADQGPLLGLAKLNLIRKCLQQPNECIPFHCLIRKRGGRSGQRFHLSGLARCLITQNQPRFQLPLLDRSLFRNLTTDIADWKRTRRHALKTGGNVLELLPFARGVVKSARSAAWGIRGGAETSGQGEAGEGRGKGNIRCSSGAPLGAR